VPARAAAPDFDAVRRALDAGLAAMDVDLDARIRARMVCYLQLLWRWNRTYNLTAVRDPLEMVPRHLLDSLSALPHVHGARCLDVGSGAGLPGLVLALADPATDWVLVDKSAKKCRFLTQARVELDLDNVRVEQRRVEDFRPGRCFSTIISRALSNLADFVAGSEHLLAPGGRFIAMKGRDAEQELSPSGASGGYAGQITVVPVQVPGIDHGQRHLVIVTPARGGN
jgi:16S rRNA (guanine527-N7)-methyltransferase